MHGCPSMTCVGADLPRGILGEGSAALMSEKDRTTRRNDWAAFRSKKYVAAEGPIRQRSLLITMLRPKATCMMQVLARILPRACDPGDRLQSQIASGHEWCVLGNLLHSFTGKAPLLSIQLWRPLAMDFDLGAVCVYANGCNARCS